jgi:hypothetical protein
MVSWYQGQGQEVRMATIVLFMVMLVWLGLLGIFIYTSVKDKHRINKSISDSMSLWTDEKITTNKVKELESDQTLWPVNWDKEIEKALLRGQTEWHNDHQHMESCGCLLPTCEKDNPEVRQERIKIEGEARMRAYERKAGVILPSYNKTPRAKQSSHKEYEKKYNDYISHSDHYTGYYHNGYYYYDD